MLTLRPRHEPAGPARIRIRIVAGSLALAVAAISHTVFGQPEPEPPPGPLAVDKTFVYFVGRRDGSIYRVPKAGGQDLVLVVAQPTPPRAIAVDDKRLYFTNAGPKVSVLWVAK